MYNCRCFIQYRGFIYYLQAHDRITFYPECSFELLYKDAILEKPDGWRDLKVDHNPKSYASFYKETCFQKVTTGAELFLQKDYVSFKKTPLKEMVKIFDYKEWPKFFTEKKK